jgi:hypothetical protein
MVWRYNLPKCPVSPEDRGEDVEPSSTQDAASQTPMVADIAQILMNGHANGKTRFEIAEDIVREFSLSRPDREGESS